MQLRERLEENRELGRAEGRAEGREEGLAEGRIEGLAKVIKVIKNLNIAGHESECIANLIDENVIFVEKIIGMMNSNPDMDDVAVSEAVLSQVKFY